MDSPKIERPSFSLLPLILLVLCVSLWFGGCLPTASRHAAVTEQDRLQMRELARRAAEAARNRDQRTADSLSAEAVELLGSGSGAVTLVGEELIRQGAPGYAAVFLTNAARETEVAQDPMVWVTLERAQDGDGNLPGAVIARDEANLRAQVVLESVGQLSPLADGNLSPEMQQAVLRYLQAGNYYTEVKSEPEKALVILREAYRLAPDSPVTRNALGYTLADRGVKPEQFDEALTLTKKAAEQMPENGSILDSYGWALYRKNDLKAALRVLEDAAEAEPDTAEIHYHLGMTLQTMGQLREAKLEFDRALLLRADYPEARRERERLR